MTDRAPSLYTGKLSDADFCSFGSPSTPRQARMNEKRCCSRYPLEEPVILETDSGELVGAVVVNHGQCGLYFESDFRAEKGTVLRIRSETALSVACQGGCEAEVRWTRRIGRKNSEYNFGTGVQYC